MSVLDRYKEFANTHFPYLRIINSDAVFAEEMPVNFFTSATGWIICDYGDAIETRSPYEKGGCSISEETPKAHIFLEQVAIVARIMELVIDKKWKSIELISGTSLLQSILWMETKRCGIILKGYEPSEKELGWYEEIKNYACQNNIPLGECVTKESTPSQGMDNLINDLEKIIHKYKWKADCQS